MYFTAVASLVPLQGEIPLKLGSGARLFILQSYVHYEIMYFTAVASLVPLHGEIPLKLGSGARLFILQS